MNCDDNNQEVIYCADDDEYRIYCIFCDKLCKKQFYENHLKPGSFINHIRK